jgi:hypothetical protein
MLQQPLSSSRETDPFIGAVPVLRRAAEFEKRFMAGESARADDAVRLYREALALLEQALSSTNPPPDQRKASIIQQKTSDVRAKLTMLIEPEPEPEQEQEQEPEPDPEPHQQPHQQPQPQLQPQHEPEPQPQHEPEPQPDFVCFTHVQYSGTGAFQKVWLSLAASGELVFYQNNSQDKPNWQVFQALELRRVMVHECTVAPPKSARKGHENALRLDTENPDTNGDKKYIISVQTAGELERLKHALALYQKQSTRKGGSKKKRKDQHEEPVLQLQVPEPWPNGGAGATAADGLLTEAKAQHAAELKTKDEAAALAASAAAAELKAVQDAAAAAADGLLTEKNSEHELALTVLREELEAASSALFSVSTEVASLNASHADALSSTEGSYQQKLDALAVSHAAAESEHAAAVVAHASELETVRSSLTGTTAEVEASLRAEIDELRAAHAAALDAVTSSAGSDAALAEEQAAAVMAQTVRAMEDAHASEMAAMQAQIKAQTEDHSAALEQVLAVQARLESELEALRGSHAAQLAAERFAASEQVQAHRRIYDELAEIQQAEMAANGLALRAEADEQHSAAAIIQAWHRRRKAERDVRAVVKAHADRTIELQKQAAARLAFEVGSIREEAQHISVQKDGTWQQAMQEGIKVQQERWERESAEKVKTAVENVTGPANAMRMAAEEQSRVAEELAAQATERLVEEQAKTAKLLQELERSRQTEHQWREIAWKAAHTEPQREAESDTKLQPLSSPRAQRAAHTGNGHTPSTPTRRAASRTKAMPQARRFGTDSIYGSDRVSNSTPGLGRSKSEVRGSRQGSSTASPRRGSARSPMRSPVDEATPPTRRQQQKNKDKKRREQQQQQQPYIEPPVEQLEPEPEPELEPEPEPQ